MSAPAPGAEGTATASAMFAPTFASLQEMTEELLDALAERDETRLRELSITRAEFDTIIWPANPNSQPPSRLTADFAWEMYRPRYERGLRWLLEAHGGIRYALKEVRFLGETEDFGDFAVHHKSLLVLDTPSGETVRARLFGAVVEQQGRFKIYGYATR